MSEKLRYLAELRTTQQRLGEVQSLLDSDLFMARLKKPEPVRDITESKLESITPEAMDALKELLDLYSKASEVLMEVEKFFREDLASNITHIDMEHRTEIEGVINKIRELQDKVQILKEIEAVGSILKNENFNLYLINEVNDILTSGIYYSLYGVLSYLEDYLLTVYNLFSEDHLSKYETFEVFKPKSLYELAKEAKKAGLPSVALDIERLEKTLYMVLSDPQSFKILLNGNKVKRAYLTIKTQYEEFLAQYHNWRTHYPILGEVIESLRDLVDSMKFFLVNALDLVRGAYGLRSLLTELGYKSPSQRLTFFLPLVDKRTNLHDQDALLKYIPDELSFSLLFNDLAYTIHRIAEMIIYYTNYLSNVLGLSNLQVYKLENCHVPLFSRISSGPLFNFAVAWLNTVCALMDSWITSEDRDSLAGYIINDTSAWFRVGSAMGHAMHVRKEGDTWIINYYDTDKPVNNTLAKLLRVIPRVEVEVWNVEPRQGPTGIDLSNSGLIIKTKDDKALPFIGAILGFATSMDLNIRDLGRDIYDAIIKYAEEISPQLALIAKAAFSPGK